MPLSLPAYLDIKQHVVAALTRYWSITPELLDILPIRASTDVVVINNSLQLQAIKLPEWASACTVNGELLVPKEACINSDHWKTVDWWLAAFLLLEGWHERNFEIRHKQPIHSYSRHLKNWDTRAWDHAWVNRIALFLRLWVAHEKSEPGNKLLGPLPESTILMTHDVDAIQKTLPIRLKQSLFHLYNAQKNVRGRDFSAALKKLRQASRFLLSAEQWWRFEDLLQLEETAGITAQYNFYAQTERKNVKTWLFDPGYKIGSPKLTNLFAQLQAKQHTIGLHSSFNAWQSVSQLSPQQEALSKACGSTIQSCRQHWLRFAWSSTWQAQEQAGIRQDTTLMFNDRPGFRNSAALTWQPWNTNTQNKHSLYALPSILMDSHFYDYQAMNQSARQAAMKKWITECELVNGEAAVLWHPHTLTKDYGWKDGFEYLLSLLASDRN